MAERPQCRAATPRRHRRFVTYDTHPDRYAHWKLAFDGPVATLDARHRRGRAACSRATSSSSTRTISASTSSSHDALQRIRFEHPEVKSVVITSGRERMFCSGANIYMLGLSTHAWKVNFCKFTNETRNGIEDSSRHSGLKFIAACNGTTAGGGYELALACDEIMLIDDRSSAVSLPEVPLLGVLPGTGGLTRVTDKRRVRRDHADIFCTLAEGVRAHAREGMAAGRRSSRSRSSSPRRSRARALELAAQSDRPSDAPGVALPPLARTIDDAGYHYEHVDVRIDRKARSATITVAAPAAAQPQELDAIVAQGAAWWPLAMARELDDAILLLRTNELEIGTWILKTDGRRRARARGRRGARAARARLVRARDDRHAAPHARAPRRHVALALRADRARLVLRRHAARARARRRPQLHARAPDDERGARRRSRSRR